jgi:hypothetical protein
MNTENFLYDIHYHAFDLSHANLTAFVERFIGNSKKQKFISKFRNIIKAIKNFKNNKKKYFNALAVFEYSIEDHFLIIEYYLKHKDSIIINNKIHIGGKDYEKLVICPLMMDFGQKSSTRNEKGFYDQIPGKPIVKQTIDLFYAIKNYYKFEFILGSTGKLEKKPITNPKVKPFLILPFLGINPENYTKGNTNTNSLFKQYFSGYEKDDMQGRITRAENSINAFLAFDGKLKDYKGEDVPRPDMFFGVKVYPPLGFNPDCSSSYDLYDLCLKKKLPITTHCSDTGFITSKCSECFTNPSKSWSDVLNIPKYHVLKLNFAHYGVQKKNKTEWREKIIEYMKEHPNVYADISSLGHEKDFYKDAITWLKDRNLFTIVNERLLFGSDFSINLMETDSYNQYLSNLKSCSPPGFRDQISISNPAKFLFDV